MIRLRAYRLRLGACFTVAAVLVAACGERPPGDDWDGAVARAVARHVEAEHPDRTLHVLGTVGGADGAALPWSVRQALVTAGIEVAEPAALADTVDLLLILDRSVRTGVEWQVDGRLQAAGDGAGAEVRWRVVCERDSCAVTGTSPSAGDS
ncbi:MAG TPA: hypothetical protein VK936_12860 [Longimicrobiales bacterium]|nr:hypothetical protein [Longimicrobiales bacterium]